MKLFYKPGACSLSPHIVLRETGLNFTLEKVDLVKKKTESGEDYLIINPKGQVPALLLEDGSLLTEGVAIMQYLADQAPDKALMPLANGLPHYRTLEWLSYISTELHKGFIPLFKPKTPDEYKSIVRNDLEKQFNYLDSVLKDSQYLQGNNFCVADAYLFVILRWGFVMKFDIRQRKYLPSYFDRVAKRPAVDAALVAEGLK
ncbi:MAG: glutathione transferase GstA [Rickettsiella sp.]|nr:glutathione transferase GstA [Rickettsiella sp.]